MPVRLPRPAVRSALVVVASATVVAALVSPAAAAGGAISGHVTTADTSALVSGDQVSLERFVPDEDDPDGGGWESVDSTDTDPNGAYSFTGLKAADYRVYFASREVKTTTGDGVQYVPHAGEWFEDRTAQDDASVIAVKSKEVSAVDAQLELAGRISGTVSGRSSDDLEQDQVTAYALSTKTKTWNYVDTTSVQEDGTYTLTSLRPGTYRLRYDDYGSPVGGPTYLPQTWKGSATLDGGQDVVLTASEPVTGIDFTPVKAGQITGTVSKADGGLAEGIDVNVYRESAPDQDGDTDYDYVESATTGATGVYVVGGLTTGTYRVEFDEKDGYARQYYQDVFDEDDASPVSVTTGQTTPGIDATLAKYGSISGKVTSGKGAALKDVDVQALRKTDDGWDIESDAVTSSKGTYSIDDLTPGTWRIAFVPVVDETYAREYFDDTTDFDQATSFTVTGDGKKYPGTNASLGLAGRISGTVKLGSGVSASDSSSRDVRIVDTKTQEIVREDRATTKKTSTSYTYSVGGLTPGSYRVEFARSSGPSLARGQYYKGADESKGSGAATAVKVKAGKTSGSIDASVKTGGTLTGTLLSNTGDPVRCQVMAINDETGRTTRAATSSNLTGAFSITGLSAGQYKVVVSSGYLNDYSDGVPPKPDDCYAIDTVDYAFDADQPSTHTSKDPADADLVAVAGSGTTEVPSTLYFGPPTGASFPDIDPPLLKAKVKPGDDVTAVITKPLESADATLQWFRGTEPIRGADAPTYRVTTADAGRSLSLRIVYSQPRYTNLTVFTAPAKVAVANVEAPNIDGRAVVGRRLSVDVGSWAPSRGVSFTYRWYRGSSPIRGATGSSYVLTRADRGRTISVHVQGSVRGYPSDTATTEGVKVR